ncbi:MAG: hypothetical protein QME49_01680 [bacterium]|nr:hypothetical protein [bacterium]
MIKSIITTKPTTQLLLNARNTISIENPGDISELLLEIKIPVAVVTGASPAIDGIEKFIKAISMYDENGKTLVNIQDIRVIRKFNDVVMPGRIMFDTLPVVAGTNYVLSANIILHAGRDYSNYEETSCLFPGQNLRRFNIDITLGANSDLGTGYTVGIPTLTPTPTRIVYENPPIERKKIFTANMIADSTSFTSTSANLSQIVELPVARFYMKSLIMVLDSSGARSDTVVERFCIRFPRDMGATSVDLNWTAARQYMSRIYPNLSAGDLVGLYLIDWTRHKHLKYEGTNNSRTIVQGFDTYKLEKGVVEIGLSTKAPGSVILFNHFSVAHAE